MTDLRPDTRRLMFLMESGIDGLANVEKDRHEYAMERAEAAGREEPNEMDELNGFRQMIDDAMYNKPQEKFADICYHYTRHLCPRYINCKTLEQAIKAAWTDLDTGDAWPLRITAGHLLWESGMDASDSLDAFARRNGMKLPW